MFWLNQNAGSPHAIAFGEEFFSCYRIQKIDEEMDMEEQNVIRKNKGGRPNKQLKKNQLLALKCTLYDRKAIETRAKIAGLSVSEYLLEVALTGKIDRRDKALPKEVLSFTAMLNHMAANLNQIARKRNGMDELSALERAELNVQSRQLKEIALQVKSYLL